MRGDGTEGDLVTLITMMIVPLMMIEDDIVDIHDIFSDRPGGSILGQHNIIIS